MSDVQQKPQIHQQQLLAAQLTLIKYGVSKRRHTTRHDSAPAHFTAVCLLCFVLTNFYVELKDNLALIFLVLFIIPRATKSAVISLSGNFVNLLGT